MNSLSFPSSKYKIMKMNLLVNLFIFTFILCYTATGQNLEVDGIGKFNLNGGSVSMTTPGGWPGIIAFENSIQHRRDIVFRESGIALLASTTGSAPTDSDGIWINEGGNVGLGTTSPSGLLEIAFGSKGRMIAETPKGSGPGWQYITPGGNRWDAYADNGGFNMERRGTAYMFRFSNYGNFGIGGHDPATDIHIVQNGGTDYSQNGIRLENYYSYPDYWTTSIDSQKHYAFAYGGNLKAWIVETDGNYNKSSDRSVKQDIHPIARVLERVKQLNPVTYKHKSHADAKHDSWGFIAQEVEHLFPDFVSEKEGLKGLAYNNFAVLAIKAIQEQQTIIEEKNREMALLRDRLSKIEAHLGLAQDR
jgi:hypothetical protein